MIGKAAKICQRIYKAGLINGIGSVVNYYRYFSYTKKHLPQKCPTTPVHLQVEISKTCNLRCKMCEYALQKSKGSFMGIDDFRKCLNKFPHIHSLDLTGIGEPLCNPDFVKIVKFALGKGVRVEFTSNGNLLTESFMDAFIDTGVDSISFSVDAATKDTYENIRLGGDFNRLRDNLTLFSRKVLQAGRKKPELHLNYTVSKENIHEVPLFIGFARDTGIKKVFYRDLITFGSGNYSDSDKISKLDNKFLSEIKESTLSQARKYGIAVIFCDSFSADNTKNKLCYRPWLSSFVDVSGNFYPCCHVLQRNTDMSSFSLGNMFKDKLADIWNSEKYQSLRKGIKEPKVVPYLCKGCLCLKK
ncbi:radical SAM protein [bacterium]|nr:MAG: radical SAM protein [bacterium]